MAASEQVNVPWPPWLPRYHYVYAAKFVCGHLKASDREGPVEPGNYATAINVHNPHAHAMALRKKAILLFNAERPEEAEERPAPPSGEVTEIPRLEPDWGLEIDCADIRRVLLRGGPPAPVFIKGWVVIETVTDLPLDVVAFYSAAPDQRGSQAAPSIETDRVPGTRTLMQSP